MNIIMNMKNQPLMILEERLDQACEDIGEVWADLAVYAGEEAREYEIEKLVKLSEYRTRLQIEIAIRKQEACE